MLVFWRWGGRGYEGWTMGTMGPVKWEKVESVAEGRRSG